MGGRGGPGGLSNYTQFYDKDIARNALGEGNGGEADTWVSNLSYDESSIVVKYTGSYYREFNKALRSAKGDETQVSRQMLGERSNLSSAISKYRLKHGTIFHRSSSASLLGGASTVAEINKLVGSVVVDHGFTSATTTYSKGGGTMFGDIQYHISTPKGKGIGAWVRPISKHKSEEEFLFNYGSGFRVDGAYESSSGVVHVNLTYLGRKQ